MAGGAEQWMSQMELLMRWMDVVPATDAQQERLQSLTDKFIDHIEKGLEAADIPVAVAPPVAEPKPAPKSTVSNPSGQNQGAILLNPPKAKIPLPGASKVAAGDYPSVIYEVRRFERLSEVVTRALQPKMGRSLSFEEIRDGVAILLESNPTISGQTPKVGSKLELGALFASFEVEPQ